MPHHWRPADGDKPAQEGKTLKYHGADKNGEKWELWEIGNHEAKELEKKPKKHAASESSIPKSLSCCSGRAGRRCYGMPTSLEAAARRASSFAPSSLGCLGEVAIESLAVEE